MAFIKTRTPVYQQQEPSKPIAVRSGGVLAWFARFLRTPTPEYQTARPPAGSTPPTQPQPTPVANGNSAGSIVE